MERIIDFLNYQPLCSNMECGPMELSGIRLIHIIMLLVVIWLAIYTFYSGYTKGRDV